MIALLEKLLPVLFIILIGWVLRKKNIVSGSAMNELKNIIINVALPCILFLSFGKTTLEARHAIVVVLVFAMLGVFYCTGFLLKNRLPETFGSIFTPWFMTGFEFGMIGIGLFGALWGADKLPMFMLIGLGHEFFAWFICIPYIQFKSSGTFSITQTLKRFLKTPVILGILGGLFVNISGLYDKMDTIFLGRAVLNAMTLLSNITVPLILMIIGYSLVLERSKSRKMMYFITVRLVLLLAVGSIVLALINLIFGSLDPLFNVAFYAFLILPPSYLVPVLVKDNEERHFFSQAVVYYTLVSFAGYIILMLI